MRVALLEDPPNVTTVSPIRIAVLEEPREPNIERPFSTPRATSAACTFSIAPPRRGRDYLTRGELQSSEQTQWREKASLLVACQGSWPVSLRQTILVSGLPTVPDPTSANLGDPCSKERDDT
jgi:hypothetical protein